MGESHQPELFVRSKRPAISLPANHPMVVLTDTLDWTEMEVRVEKIRGQKLKNAAGRPPNLRAPSTTESSSGSMSVAAEPAAAPVT